MTYRPGARWGPRRAGVLLVLSVVLIATLRLLCHLVGLLFFPLALLLAVCSVNVSPKLRRTRARQARSR